MRSAPFASWFAGLAGFALLAIGLVYLTVACEALPAFLGPTAGDTSPRTGLGLAGVVLGAAALIAAFVVARRRRPNGSAGS